MTMKAIRVSIPAVAAMLALLLALTLGAAPTQAGTTYVVTRTSDTPFDEWCDADCSLREALLFANGFGGADTIIVPAGTYTLDVGGGEEDNNETGDLDIREEVTITGDGAGSTIIDGNGAVLGERVIHITGAFPVTISGVTIRNGNPSGDGGGIYNAGTLTLNDSVVSGNRANGGFALGGGILSSGTLTLNNSTVSGNHADYGGGGIFSSGTLTLNSSTLRENDASGINGGSGGGLYNYSATATLSSSIVTSNTGFGGIDSEGIGAVLTLIDSTVSGNQLGIYSQGTATLDNTTVSGNLIIGGIISYGDMTLTNSSVSGNAGRDAGGIQSDGALTLTSSAVYNNTASNPDILSVGGVWSYGGDLTVDGSAISGNSADSVGGVYSQGSSLTVNGSTVSGNSVGNNGGVGGVFNEGDSLTVSGSTISGNTTPSFAGVGGLYNSYTSSSASVNNSTVSGNGGTGIYHNGTDLSLSGSTVSGNISTAGQGFAGGVSNGFGTMTITNTTVSGNATGISGTGGISNHGGTVSVLSSTVANNSGAYPGILNNVNTPFNIKNSIVTNSCLGTLTSLGYNLGVDATCQFTSIGDIVDPNPLLGPLASNGGPTKTHALLQDSPALNNGDPACPAPAADQRGVSRPQGPRCDIGAFEAVDTDGDATPDAYDDNDDNDPSDDAVDGCRTIPEDVDGFEDGDGCPDADNDLDGICDAGQTSVACVGSDVGRTAFYGAGHNHREPDIDCRNMAEDYDDFWDWDGCPEPDNDNDGFPDFADDCPGTDQLAGADGVLGSGEDQNHNGRLDSGEDQSPFDGVLTTDDVVLTFEDYDTVLDTDGCHDSPGDDRDGDGFTDENEVLKIGTRADKACGADGWPADLAGNDNRLNIGDLNSFLFPLRGDGSFAKFGHPVPDTNDPDIARWNLQSSNSVIDIGDLNALNPAVSAPTSRPPMFGGQPAFFTDVGNGVGGCPIPP